MNPSGFFRLYANHIPQQCNFLSNNFSAYFLFPFSDTQACEHACEAWLDTRSPCASLCQGKKTKVFILKRGSLTEIHKTRK